MSKELSTNRRALHDFEILEEYEAGLVLTGAEIKAIRAGKAHLAGSYARVLENKGNQELFWVGGQVALLEGDPQRTRKLLLNRNEIEHLIGKMSQKGLTLVPLRLYLKKGRAKLALGLARGKKLHDKREAIKKKNLRREMEQKE